MASTQQSRKRKQSTEKGHQAPPHPRQRQRETSPQNSSKSSTLAADSKSTTVNSKKRRVEPQLQTLESRVGGVALTFGSGDTGQLGLGEDVLDRKKPAIVKADEMTDPIVQVWKECCCCCCCCCCSWQGLSFRIYRQPVRNHGPENVKKKLIKFY